MADIPPEFNVTYIFNTPFLPYHPHPWGHFILTSLCNMMQQWTPGSPSIIIWLPRLAVWRSTITLLTSCQNDSETDVNKLAIMNH